MPVTAAALVVETDPSMARLFSLLLSGLVCEVFVASDGASGLQLAREHQLDLVIARVELPDMDGPQFVRELRAASRNRHIHTILTSIYPEPTHVADEFLQRPFDIERFLETAARFLEMSAAPERSCGPSHAAPQTGTGA
jgi:CheY-like chemotaxis protein